MPVHVKWQDDAHTVLEYRFEGNWNWNETRMAVGWADVLMRVVEHPLTLVLHVQETDDIPHGAWDHLVNAAPHTHHRIRRIVALGATRNVRFVGELFHRIYGVLPEYRETVVEPLGATTPVSVA